MRGCTRGVGGGVYNGGVCTGQVPRKRRLSSAFARYTLFLLAFLKTFIFLGSGGCRFGHFPDTFRIPFRHFSSFLVNLLQPADIHPVLVRTGREKTRKRQKKTGKERKREKSVSRDKRQGEYRQARDTRDVSAQLDLETSLLSLVSGAQRQG